MICPVCVANAVITVAGVGASTGGFGVMALRLQRWKKAMRIRSRDSHGRITGHAASARRREQVAHDAYDGHDRNIH
jgi:hypothetical protein